MQSCGLQKFPHCKQVPPGRSAFKAAIQGFRGVSARHPQVANGATDLLSQPYGEVGAHARYAVGMAAVPKGVCIEIEMIMGVED